MIALISNIHSNLEALTAVLNDIKCRRIETVYCLGDILGYGPNPRECLEIVGQCCTLTLLGGYDSHVLCRGENISSYRVHEATTWIYQQILSTRYSETENNKLWNFLEELKTNVSRDGILYVHGSPQDPLHGYLIPNDVQDRLKMESIFTALGGYRLCFVGHNHIPGMFTEDFVFHSNKEVLPQAVSKLPLILRKAKLLLLWDVFSKYHRFHETENREWYKKIDSCIAINAYQGKKVINVGSVGRPRDGDNRACYVIFDGEMVEWIRVPYNIDITISKIMALPLFDKTIRYRIAECLQKGQ